MTFKNEGLKSGCAIIDKFNYFCNMHVSIFYINRI